MEGRANKRHVLCRRQQLGVCPHDKRRHDKLHIRAELDVFSGTQNVTFIGNMTSDCQDETIGDASVTFYSTHDGTDYFSVPNPANTNSTHYNATWERERQPEGNYSVTMNSSKNLYNPNSTTASNLFHHQMNPQLPNSDCLCQPDSGQWGTTFSFNYRMTDDDDNVTAYMWRRCTGGNTTPSSAIPCGPSTQFELYQTPGMLQLRGTSPKFSRSMPGPSTT